MMAYLNKQRVPWYLPFICGLFIDALFFGLICVLVAKWAWSVRQTDRFWIKIMVQYQFVISCVLSGIVMSHAYRIFIAGFGDFTANLVPGRKSLLGRADPSLALDLGVVRARSLSWRPLLFASRLDAASEASVASHCHHSTFVSECKVLLSIGLPT